MSVKHAILKPLALCALLGLSSSALANVTITFPPEVDILATNSQDPETDGGFFSSTKSVTLPDGENQIVFRYSPVFKTGNDQEVVSTDAIIAKFTATDADLTLEVPKYRTPSLARDFDNNPNWKLVDKDGNEVAYQQDKLLKPGVQLGRKYDRESEDYNKKGGVAAITLAGTTAAVVATSAPAPAAATTIQAPANSQYKTTEEQMLHYWYDKADQETKQRFLQAIIQAK
ncbi:DUF2057 family protein [Vibrio gangliei]|uniref:DUF2057 family protein n=1 Tax=Vibrio gangliei TaxID=2077090 RepID=UPI000D016515|nr:DUF2057 family protein [Vibrio gangliei]